MAKRSRAGRLRIHVENDPHHSEVYHITPALFGRRVRRSPGLAGRIAITYGQDPALLDAALAESEVLVVGNIDGTGLADKLRRGELSGAVLDVFSEEPLPASSPLWTVPNLIISPHCAADDSTSYAERALDIFVGNLERYLAGRRLVNLVDKTLGY